MLNSNFDLNKLVCFEQNCLKTLPLSSKRCVYSDPKAIQLINFTTNLDRERNTRIFFILEEAKEAILDF